MKEQFKKYFPQRFEDASIKESLFKVNYDSLERHNIACQVKVHQVLERFPELKLLSGAMKKYGCKFDPKRHVICEFCNVCKGGYDPETNQIIICTNVVTEPRPIARALMHEMIHMFDYCRAELDPNNLEHIACTEMRAANLTFCGLSEKFRFGDAKLLEFKGFHGSCVKDVAFRSLKFFSPETDEDKLNDIVNKVFPYCYNDLEPFGRRPIPGTNNMKQAYKERFFYGYS